MLRVNDDVVGSATSRFKDRRTNQPHKCGHHLGNTTPKWKNMALAKCARNLRLRYVAYFYRKPMQNRDMAECFAIYLINRISTTVIAETRFRAFIPVFDCLSLKKPRTVGGSLATEHRKDTYDAHRKPAAT